MQQAGLGFCCSLDILKDLYIKAPKIGWLMQGNSDGYTPNKRLNLALGLTSNSWLPLVSEKSGKF